MENIRNRVLVLLICLLLPAIGYSQQPEKVVKFKAHYFLIETLEDKINRNVPAKLDWKECNVLVIVGNDKITFYLDDPMEYSIIKVINKSENDEAITYTEDAVDNYGVKVTIYFNIFKKGISDGYQASTVAIYYPHFTTMYQLWNE